jgi:hypothetical protein
MAIGRKPVLRTGAARVNQEQGVELSEKMSGTLSFVRF